MKTSSWLEKVPRFAKVLIPLQMLLNLLLLAWMYEEYLSNRFLRVYVNDSLQSGASAAVIVVSIGFFAILAMGLFVKLLGYRRDLDRLLSTGTLRPVEEGFVNRSIRRLKIILSRLFGRLRRASGSNPPSARH